MDDKRKRGKADRIRININQQHERVYWSQAFGITRDALERAVKAVGPMVSDVKRYLIVKIERAE